MRRLIVFNHVSLDGYFVDAKGDMSWAKAGQQDPEWDAFVSENASGGGILVFGRVTYEMMASFWPTPFAIEHMPVVAEAMNSMPKIVFSRTLDRASWNNSTLLKGNLVMEMRRLKEESEEDMAIIGSGTLVAQLAPERLVDEFQIVVNPIVLGQGRTLFEGVTEKLPLKRTKTRAFANGNVLVCYAPTA